MRISPSLSPHFSFHIHDISRPSLSSMSQHSMAPRHSVSPAGTPYQHGQSTTAQPYSEFAVPATPTGSNITPHLFRTPPTSKIFDLGFSHLQDPTKIVGLYPAEDLEQEIQTIFGNYQPHHHVTVSKTSIFNYLFFLMQFFLCAGYFAICGH